MIETHGNTEQGQIKRGSSPRKGLVSDIIAEMQLEPRAVWALWLVCFMFILLILGVMVSPYDLVGGS